MGAKQVFHRNEIWFLENETVIYINIRIYGRSEIKKKFQYRNPIQRDRVFLVTRFYCNSFYQYIFNEINSAI